MDDPIATCIVPMVPASVLLPNQASKQAHWSARAAARAELRMATYFTAQSTNTIDRVPLATGPVRLSLVIAWPRRRRIVDFDAAVSCCKSLVDGLQDARWVADDKQVVAMEIRQERDPAGLGWVRVEMHHV